MLTNYYGHESSVTGIAIVDIPSFILFDAYEGFGNNDDFE